MKQIYKYLITFLVGLLFAVIIMLTKSIFFQDNVKDVMHILTDAFFVPGVIICGFGLLVVASNGGTFDILSYGLISFFNLFRKDINKRKYKTFYDYRVAHHEKPKGFWYLVFVGLFYICLSLLFLYIYEIN